MEDMASYAQWNELYTCLLFSCCKYSRITI